MALSGKTAAAAKTAAKTVTGGRAKKSAAGAGTTKAAHAKAAAHRHDDDDEEVVTFDLSSQTTKTIDAAMKGLTGAQRDRVMAAIDAVGDDVGILVARWVEKDFVRNANELLVLWTPAAVKDESWAELRGVWLFLDHMGVKIDHRRIAKAVEKAQGADAADRYREAATPRRA